MKKILEFIKNYLKNNRLITVGIIVLLLMVLTIKLQRNTIFDLKDEHQNEIKLNNALNDSVSFYKNVYGEVVAEKLTIQETVKNLEKINNKLTESERELIARVKEANKENTVIAAALVEANLIIKLLQAKGNVVINSKDTTITFSDTTKHMEYEIVIGKVIPMPFNVKPTLLFRHMKFQNKQMVKFIWENDKKEGYPVKFTMSNSNPYYKINKINSYIIPNIIKEDIDPTGWQKFEKWFVKNGKTVIYISAGAAGGAAGTYILMK